jgi:hypothetical protein
MADHEENDGSLHTSESEVAPLSYLSTSTISTPLTPQSSTAASLPLDSQASPQVSFRNSSSSVTSPASPTFPIAIPSLASQYAST